MSKSSKTAKPRIRTLDFARGFLVAGTAFLTHILAAPQFAVWNTHAEWFGLTVSDFAFPVFITLFGTAMAIAYRNGVKKLRLLRRTIMLILIGLVFNMIVNWNFDLSTLRFTGILQVYAVLGVLVVLITRLAGKWYTALGAGLLIMLAYQGLLVLTSAHFPQGLPQPDHNLSGIIDPLLFGPEHIYRQGQAGYDPEGIFTMLSATANAICGYAAGKLILEHKKIAAVFYLIILGCGLLLLSPLLAAYIPFAKKIWTPAFASLTAGASVLLLAISHALFHTVNNKPLPKIKAAVYWFFEAFGRNAFLVFFGKFVLIALMRNLSVPNQAGTYHELLSQWVFSWSPQPHLTYAFIIFAFWTALALFLHKIKLYIKI